MNTVKIDLSDIPDARPEETPQTLDLSDIPDVTEETKPESIELSDIPDAGPRGAGGSFGPSLPEKAIDFITGGHVTFDPHKLAPPPEVRAIDEQAKEVPSELEFQPPETAEMGFFEDPITWASMAALQAFKYGGTAGAKLLRGARELAAWATGGASEAPGIAKGGAKIAAKAAAAKPMEKTMARAALEQPLGREAVKLAEKEAVAGIPAAGRLAPESEFLQKEFGERFVKAPEKPKIAPKIEVKPKEVVSPPEPKFVPEKFEVTVGVVPEEETKGYVNILLDEVKQGKAPETLKFVGEYGHPEYKRMGSTYPEFMRDKGWTGKEVKTALEKGLKGAKLGKRQQEIWDNALIEGRVRYERDAKSLGKIAPEEELPKDLADISSQDLITLYGGIPIHKAGEAYTKHIGEPVWDTLVMKKIPKLLEKVPGGKAVNRALIYSYRGDLPNTAKYIHSMEDMRKAQSVGREYAIDLGKRLQKLPEESQLKMGEYITTKEPTVKLSPEELKLAKEAKTAMLDLGKQAVDAGLLAEETFFKNAGRYMPRLYTSKEYQGLLTRFSLKKPVRLDLSRFKMRKDIPKEIRQEMGEILTPGYPIAKGITQLTHDIEMARFFKGIASNKDWARPGKRFQVLAADAEAKTWGAWEGDTVIGVFGSKKEALAAKAEALAKYEKANPIPEGWKQLEGKKLGVLDGAYVHPEIHADLQETIRVIETPEKVWRKALGAWKFGKVIVSPKTHVRNLMSNSVLAHLGGLPMYEQPVYLTKAAIAMKKKGKYWEAIRKEGGFEHTFTSGELNALFDQVEGQMAGIKAGSIPEKLGTIGNSWAVAKKGLRKAADLYQAEEQWFKMAKFIHNVERKGMSNKAAWADAEKWLFNYQKITKFQEKYRSRWYGAPFATFTFKAMPRMAEAMIKTPWRFALPMAIIYSIEKAAQRKIGDTKEEIEAKKELRPEWMKGSILGIPNFARVAIIDDYGREHWYNLTYTCPWGDIGEGGKFGPIPGGLVPFSQPFVKEPWQQIANYDSFWKEEIVKEEDLAGKTKIEQLKVQAKERGKHLAQAMLPTPVFDISKIIDAFTERPDYRGRFKKPSVVAADVIAGVKMYPVDYTEQVIRQVSKLDPERGYLAKKIYAQIRTYAIKKKALEKKGAKTEFYDKKIEEKMRQLQGLAGEAGEVGELYKKIKK